MLLRSLLLLLLPLCVWTSARADASRFRTEPSGREAGEIARGWLLTQPEAPEPGDLIERDRHVSRRGVTHLYFRQRLQGREIFQAGATAAVDAQGRLFVARDRFVRGLRRRSRAARVSLSAEAAIASAGQTMGVPLEPLSPRLPPKLVWFPVGDSVLRLGWELAVRTPDDSGWWGVVVDAGDGTLLFQNPWFASDSYRTLVPPLVSPAEGPRVLVVDPADPIRSPLGWHDLDGVPGADATDTTGNNAYAQEDADANNNGGLVAQGGPSRVFDFPFEGWRPPETYVAASISQLFYLNNWLHDLHAHYGFDEASGNFQQVNYAPPPPPPANPPLGGDPVLADAQDGQWFNNANFFTPPEGMSPRMQMFLYLDTRLEIAQPPAIAGTVHGGRAHFGRALEIPGTSGQLVQALPTDGCSAFTNAGATFGRIAFVERGSCEFTVKAANAQAAGAIGVVIANDTALPPLVTMTGEDPSIAIPALFVTQADGNLIRAQLPTGVLGTLAGFARDASMDLGVVIHEYGHGVTNRLTGGPSDVNCLAQTQSRGMGEGWSDFWAIALTAKPGDSRTLRRPIGTYLIGQPPTGPGLRTYPFTPDMSANPLTYASIGLSAQQHFVGTIWASALWELFWNLVEPYGFDPDLAQGDGGNNRALKLVMDALKVQGCEPTFLVARDAILEADGDANEGRNRCRIWTAFAKRGMGDSAADGGSSASQDVTEAFDLPPGCTLCGDVDDNEVVDLRDVALALRAQAGVGPSLVAPEKCNSLGDASVGDADADGVLDDCDADDVVAVRDYLAGNSAQIPAVCAPAVGIFR